MANNLVNYCVYLKIVQLFKFHLSVTGCLKKNHFIDFNMLMIF